MKFVTNNSEKFPIMVKPIKRKEIAAVLPGYSKGRDTKIALPALLIIIFYQYMGIPQYVPALKGLNLDFFLSLAVLILLVIHRGTLRGLLAHKQSKIILCFLAISCVSIFYALIGTKVLTILIVTAGNFIFFCICYSVFKNIRYTNVFIVFFVAIHTLLVILNINSLRMPGRTVGIQGGSFLGDLNDFGWSLAVVLPFAIYLFLKTRGIFRKFVSFGSSLIILTGILLTQSRGAAIAVVVSAAWFVLSGRRRVIGLALLIATLMLAVTIAPDSFIHRMNTIKDYNEDSSARGRLMAWRAAVAMAIDHPAGVGPGNFPNIYGRFYREKYADPTVWSPNRWIAVHSIYFLTLAEYGFLGAFLLLLLLYSNFRGNLQITGRNESGSRGNASIFTLGRILNWSLVAFATGGIFLGGLHYPHIYILTAMTIGLAASSRNPILLIKHEMATKSQTM